MNPSGHQAGLPLERSLHNVGKQIAPTPTLLLPRCDAVASYVAYYTTTRPRGAKPLGEPPPSVSKRELTAVPFYTIGS